LIKKPRRAALYVRVSTDRQTVANQVEVLAAVAAARGWDIVATYADNGLSGAKGRKERPGLDALLNDAQRGKFNVVMAWAIDRIGRSLIDLLGTIQHLEACGCDLYLDQQAIDTTTPSGKLMFQICGAFGEFERSMIRERINAGLARARRAGKVLGRKQGTVLADPAKLEAARKLLAGGTGIGKTARAVGLGTGTVHRLKQSMATP
jgi:DNA invertase Pin-like site-specific DNA recombinase